MNAKDTERVKKNSREVYGHIAKQMLKGEETLKKISIVGKYTIDHDGRSQPASVRLLQAAGVIVPHRDETYQVLGFEEHGPEHMVEPEFDTTFDKLYEPLTDSNGTSSRNLAGYSYIHQLSDANALWVYFHKEDYFFYTAESVYGGNPQKVCYPRALEDKRIRGLLQAIVEYDIQTNYSTYVEKYLELPKDACCKSTTKDIELRNFAHYPASLTDEFLESYQKEYTFYLEYMQKLHANLQLYRSIIASKGGCKSLIERMRRDSIKKLDDDILLHVNLDKKAENYGYDSGLDFTKNNKSTLAVFKFIMEHSDLFNYEYLFGTEDVSFLNLGYDDNTKFEPPTDCQLIVDPDYKAPPEPVEEEGTERDEKEMEEHDVE